MTAPRCRYCGCALYLRRVGTDAGTGEPVYRWVGRRRSTGVPMLCPAQPFGRSSMHDQNPETAPRPARTAHARR